MKINLYPMETGTIRYHYTIVLKSGNYLSVSGNIKMRYII